MVKPGQRRTTWLAALLLTAFAACATMGGVSSENAARIIVDNQHGPLGTVQIWVVPETGIRSLIGNVGAARIDTLTFGIPTAAGEYRLRAEPATGGEIFSRPFRFLSGPTVVRWDLGSNTLFVTEP